MTRKSKALCLFWAGLFACSPSAFAGYLVDTGVPNPTNADTDFSPAVVRGMQFTVTSPVTITSVEHWASIDAPDEPGDPNDGVASVRMFIRAQASSLCVNPFPPNPDFPCPAGTPFDSTQDLFGADFTVPNTYGSQGIPQPAWIGLSGLNWVLNPGTYWLIRTQTLTADFQSVLFSPFCNEANGCTGFAGQPYEDSNRGAGGWSPNSARTGWRIGIQSQVPEPGTLALLGLGLAALGMSRRRREN